MMSGDLALLKLQASLEVKFDGLDIAPLDPYAAPTFDMRVSSGKLSVDGKVRASLLDPAHPAFAYQGNLLLQDLLAVDGVKRGEFLKCKRMEIAPIDYSLEPQHLHVGDLTIDNGEARLSYEADGSNNLYSILRIPTPPPASEGESETQPPSKPAAPPASSTSASSSLGDITARRLRLRNSRLVYEDHTTQPAIHYTIDSITGTVSGLSSKELARADVSLEARVGGTAPVKIAGKINPLSENSYSDL